MTTSCLRFNFPKFNPVLRYLQNFFEPSVTDRKLREVMGRYLEQIRLISQGKPNGNCDSILAPDFRKILNGKLVSSTREAFIEELQQVNKTLGNWTIEARKMICSPQDRVVVLGLEIALNQKNYIATVFFHFNRENLISALDETFAEASGSYQFEMK